MLDGSGRVGLDALLGRLLDVLHVLEVVAALLDAGRSPEVVERERRVAALGEAEGELLVEPVQPTDVGEDHDPGRGRLVRGRQERGEAVSVTRLQHQVIVRDGGAGDDGDRRDRVELEAHGPGSVGREVLGMSHT